MKQGTKEWFDARKGLITGSAVGAIMGLSPYKTREDVMRDMVREYHGLESEFKGNVATEWGNNHEKIALQQFELLYSPSIVEECGFFKKDWFGASPDGLVGDKATVEIKCPYGLRADEDPEFKPVSEQLYYYAQIQMQLLATGREKCFFYQWTPYNDDVEVVDIDNDFISSMLGAAHDFYQAYIVERELPNAQIYLEDKRQKVESKFISDLAKSYLGISEKIKELEVQKKGLLAEIVSRTGERDSKIGELNLTKVTRVGSVDYKKVPELEGVNLDPYRKKPTSYWSLK